MNIMPMLRTVGIQEASSNPKPSAPRKPGKPTLTRRPLRVAVAAPRKTPRMPIYGCVATGAADPGADWGTAPVILIDRWFGSWPPRKGPAATVRFRPGDRQE